MPRTFTAEKTVYTYDELSQKAKEKAMDWFAQGGMESDWYESIYELEEGIRANEYEFDIDGNIA